MSGRARVSRFRIEVPTEGITTHVFFVNADPVILSQALEAETQLEGTTISLLDRNGALIARSSEAEKFFGVEINARDAMPSGGQLVIATRNLADVARPLVEVSVSDDGVGMDPSTRGRIFEPFFTTKGAQGTGLGLATVYGIIKQSDGDVTCESIVGSGTTFRVRPPGHAGIVAPPEVAQPQPIGGSETIVLVDDDDGVRTLLTMLLTRRGYQVRAAGNPREALQWFAEGLRADLLLTDVRMPEMSGTALTRAVKEIDPGLRIIMMSGDAAPALAEHQIAGATLEQKPITPPVLLRAIRARLDEARIDSPSTTRQL